MDAETARRTERNRLAASAMVGVSMDRQWLLLKFRLPHAADEVVAVTALEAPRLFEAFDEALRRLRLSLKIGDRRIPLPLNQPDMLPSDWISPIGGAPMLHIFSNEAVLAITGERREWAYRLTAPIIALLLTYRAEVLAALDTSTSPGSGKFDA